MNDKSLLAAEAEPINTAVRATDLKPCPFCGHKPPIDLIDTLYPSGFYWADHGDGFRHYGDFNLRNRDGTNQCWSMNCTQNSGGCGAEVTGDSRAEAIAAWNSRAVAAPITDAEIVRIWDAQRKYHGGEPCKLSHLEFARALLSTTGEPKE